MQNLEGELGTLHEFKDTKQRREEDLSREMKRFKALKRQLENLKQEGQDEMEAMKKKIDEKEELLESVREEYEELGLVYDEDEVKAALEVKYLLEQMEKIADKENGNGRAMRNLLDAAKRRQALRLQKQTGRKTIQQLQSLTLEDIQG